MREFHEAFGLVVADEPTVELPSELIALRLDLLREEFGELEKSANDRDLVGIADALADIAYVLYGTALTFGVDLDAVVCEIHRSNMTKLDEDGKPLMRSDGKVLKGSCYEPPDVEAVLKSSGQKKLRLVVEG